MTRCNFSVRSAREEMRHVIRSSEPDVIIGSDKDQWRGCKKRDKDHMKFFCELYEVQEACGRHFVHAQTSEVNSWMQCVAMINGMPGTRTIVADLRMFVLAACDEGRTRICQRKCTDGHQRETMRMQSKCTGVHRHVWTRTTQSRKWNKQEHGYIKLPEQWRNS